jgi:hypothetical protein
MAPEGNNPEEDAREFSRAGLILPWKVDAGGNNLGKSPSVAHYVTAQGAVLRSVLG